MITAIDSSVLIDILEPDPVYGPLSKEALKSCLTDGSVLACEVVWAEVGTAYGHDIQSLVDALDSMGIQFSALSRNASLEAARRWFDYRQRGGTRKRIAADFLIGAHAVVQCERLLTRDRGFFRDYFSNLELFDPSESDTGSDG
jgi:hypothetical protein